MRTQRKLYLALPVLTFILIVALFSGFAPTRAQEQENTLTIAISGDVETLDPQGDHPKLHRAERPGEHVPSRHAVPGPRR